MATYFARGGVTDNIGTAEKREALAKTIDAYSEDFQEDFFWATGPQAPVLLYHLMMSIDSATRPDAESKPRPVIRLVDRKPIGNA